MPSSVPAAVLFDDTALLALGAGHRLASQLVVTAHGHTQAFVYAPAMCLAGAVAERPGLADHVGSLIAIRVLDLSYESAARVGSVIAGGVAWQQAHALVAAAPTLEWPSGLPVLTSEPESYRSSGVRTIPLAAPA